MSSTLFYGINVITCHQVDITSVMSYDLYDFVLWDQCDYLSPGGHNFCDVV